MNKDFLGCVEPEIAEIMSMKEALSWIAAFQWSNVHIESDSLVCIQALQSSIHFPSQFGYLVSDCKLLLSQLPSISFSCIKRSANRAAHCLARASCFCPGLSVQEEVLTPDVIAIVMADFVG